MYTIFKGDTEHSKVHSSILCFSLECGVVCHCKCSMSLPRTCGLPSQYVEHFSESLRGPKTETSLLVSPGNNDLCDGKETSMEGYLKVPRLVTVFNHFTSAEFSLYGIA